MAINTYSIGGNVYITPVFRRCETLYNGSEGSLVVEYNESKPYATTSTNTEWEHVGYVQKAFANASDHTPVYKNSTDYLNYTWNYSIAEETNPCKDINPA